MARKPVIPKKPVKPEPMPGEYREEIEKEFKGIETASEEAVLSETNSGGPPEFETEIVVPEDYTEVSSDEPAGGEVDMEPPEYGQEGGPTETETASEIEPEVLAEATEEQKELIKEKTETDRTEAMADEANLLDAWYAEYGDPATMALAQQQPKLTESLMETVIGKDDRIQIKNTTAYPWRSICSLIITAKDGSRWIGTGWLAGPRLVMTAGHVVYMHKHGGWAKSIEVIPGRNGASRPYGQCTSSRFVSVKGWTEKGNRSNDYGGIILSKECEYGNKVGYFGIADLGFFSLLGLKVNLSGYPGDKPTGTQWWHARRIWFVTARTLVYNIDTYGGQSGSPVWRLKNGQRHAVGIHTNGSPLGNSATRIVKPVFNNIKNWKNL